MFVNLSNHPSKLWSQQQIEAAIKIAGEIEDIPFPQIDPKASLGEVQEIADKFFAEILILKEKSKNEKFAVLAIGEFTFTYLIINLCRNSNIPVYCSTTVRVTSIDKEGNKISIFNFERFREYF